MSADDLDPPKLRDMECHCLKSNICTSRSTARKILKDLAVNAGEVHAIMPERFGRGGNSGAGAS
jgi:hypothetical protein